MTYKIFSLPRVNVSMYNKQLTYCGIITVQYFIFIVLKDLVIFFSQLFFGGFLGFWNAIVLHIITLPLDVIVLLVLAIWGSIILNQKGTRDCNADASCKPFVSEMH